ETALGALPEEALRTVRADVTEMDVLLDGVAQTHAQIAGLRRRFGGLAPLRSLAQRLQEQLAARGAAPTPRPVSGARKALALADELSGALADCAQAFGLSLDQMDRELRQVRDAAEQLRLVPAGALFTTLERSARDAAQAMGKRVVFDGRGGDVRLDSPVLGAVQNALVQLVRNAVAHGIEGTAQRLAAGKTPEGRITLDVLIVEAGGTSAAIPFDAVRRTLRLQPAQIARGAQGDSIVFDERAIPYLALARVLGASDAGFDDARPVSAVVVEGAGALAAIGVERLGATAKIVLRPLPELAP